MSNVQVQINQLPQATTLTGSELVPIVQNGQTRQVTVGQIASSPTLTQTFLTVTNQTSTLANSRYIGAGSGLIGTDNGAGLNYVLSLTGAPLALYNNTNGIQVKTGANTMSSVQIAVGTGLSISNPDGTGGNPTISLSSFLASLASVSGTGLLAVSGGSSATPVTLTGGTGITITNGNGSGGNPTFALSSSGVTAGSYTLSNVTVDNYGRVTSASSASTTGTGNVVLSASPALTGTPTAPTPSTGTNSTQIATTAFVLNQISASSSSGTVTSVGLTMPSGFSVSSSPITTSGTISVSTTLNGILKGTGSGFTTATSGTDYAPATSGTSLLYGNGSGGFSNVSIGSGISFSGGTLSATSAGTVTSVGLSLPSIFSVTNSPVTTSGTLTANLATQNANYVFAGPTSTSPGTPTFRALVSADIPSLNYAPPTSGTSILYGNGSGGFSNVTIGTGITFSGGTLSAPSTMVYPGAGIPNSTGSAWGTSYSTTGTNKVVLSTAPTFDTTTAFTPIAQPSYAEGLLWYDSTQKALSYFNDVSNNVITIGQETQVKVRNGTGSTIAGGIAVYVTSTSSGAIYPNVAPAQANSLSTSAVIGLTTASIASGGVGYVTTAGLLSPANTGTFTVGDILYLSPYSAGQIQNTVPPTGYAIQIGTVAYSNNPNGSIYVKQTTPLSVPASIITGTVAISQGGTGSTTASGALTALGAQPLLTTTSNLSLNQITAQVATLTTAQIQSLTVSQLTTLTTANVSNLVATGGTIDNTVIGGTTPSAGTFTTITGQTETLKGTGENLFIRSQQFSYWASAGGASNVTGTDNASTAPDGSSTATNVVPNTTNGLHRTYSPLTLSVSSGAVYTMTFYAKANGYRYLYVNSTNLGMTAVFDVQAGTVTNGVSTSATITAVTGATGWYKLVTVGTATVTSVPSVYYQFQSSYALGDQSFAGDGTSGILMWGAQLEFGSTSNTYVPTTTTAVYGTPTLSFSGVSTIGLQNDGSLFVQPAGTGALQAQKTDSTATGGNARGANAVDWQTSRSAATQVASATQSTISGGVNHTVSSQYGAIGGGTSNTVGSSGFVSTISGGFGNNSNNSYTFVGGGTANTASGIKSLVVGGESNSALGIFNYVGGGYANSGTSNSAVTTQSGTMNGTTAVTLSGSNASIKVGQLILGTSIASGTYVAAVSGTSLTLSQAASGSSTNTLSFYTPHGVVVGGGNNQATGSYSFVGGGGDAGNSANKNLASGIWSSVVGGLKNISSSDATFVGGGYGNTASGLGAVVVGGGLFGSIQNAQFSANVATGQASSIGGGFGNQASGYGSTIAGGQGNVANANWTTALGAEATTRSIINNFAVGGYPISQASGLSQIAFLILGIQTTTATATVLTSDGSAAGTTNQVILPNNSAYYFKGSVIANVTGAADGASWSFEGSIMRGANAGSTVLIGTPMLNRVAVANGTGGSSSWVVAISADTTNGGLAITVTGVASTTIRWVAKVETTEVTF